MNTRYDFNQNETERIINHFGKDFYEKVLTDIDIYAEKWALTFCDFIPSYSAKLVFKCHSEVVGNVVLKIGDPSLGRIFAEVNTLREYSDKRFCRVFEADVENGVVLEECLQPGTPLRHQGSLDKRLSVFCSLYKGFHIYPSKVEIYPTYTEWVCKITEYIGKRQDCKELYPYMKRAKEICLSVSVLYPQKVLLHGDFHHDNILLSNNGDYKIIDPLGVIGAPVFDVPCFIMNEFCDVDDERTIETFNKTNYIISVLENNLNIPSDTIKKCLFVGCALGIGWAVQGGDSPEKYIKDVIFTEAVMTGEWDNGYR